MDHDQIRSEIRPISREGGRVPRAGGREDAEAAVPWRNEPQREVANSAAANTNSAISVMSNEERRMRLPSVTVS